MSQSKGEFREQLVRSGLMTDEEVGHFLAGLPEGKPVADASALARELVSAGRLTKYQASAVFQGKTQGLVLGKYIVLDKIGAGGMGQVYKAFDRRMERVVALKLLPASALAEPASPDQLHVANVPRIEAPFQAMAAPEAVARLYREARAAARLHHPNIVTVYDADEAGGVYFLAMEYLEGRDLASLVKERHPLPVEEAVDYILQAARGLEYAHQHGIVHRDIKPANLVLDERSTVKILDMGLARIVSQTDNAVDKNADTGRLTKTGQVVGTVDYMSPEQAEDMREADERSDIYSLGCTLFALLTGRPPYSGDTWVKKFLAHREAEIPSSRTLRPDVPARLDSVISKMVAKLPADRHQSMGELICELESSLGLPSRKQNPRVKTSVRPGSALPHTAEQNNRASHSTNGATLGEVFENSLQMRLVFIPPGEFEMGSPEVEEGRNKGEKLHRVQLTKGYLLGAHPVTIGQFREFVLQSKYRTEAETDGKGGFGWHEAKGLFVQHLKYTWRYVGFAQEDDFPVVNVSWNDAQAFCTWLGNQERRTYRLPTEAEWEYACRAGTNTAYAIGDDPESLAKIGNVADGSAKAKFPNWSAIEANDGYVFASPVGTFEPNAFGLFDMHGNVWEWCSDWYGEYAGHAVDPQGAATGTYRVSRGGSWRGAPRRCRSAYRSRNVPSHRNVILGLRVALVPQGE